MSGVEVAVEAVDEKHSVAGIVFRLEAKVQVYLFVVFPDFTLPVRRLQRRALASNIAISIPLALTAVDSVNWYVLLMEVSSNSFNLLAVAAHVLVLDVF